MYVEFVLSVMFFSCSLQRVSSVSGLSSQGMLSPTYMEFGM
jgi:hypothetical protein